MSLYYDMSGTWRTVRYVWTKVGGNWREVPQIYVKVDGTWYPIWEYEWVPSSWSSCSKTCGGGTQTRTLTCQRNDGFTYDNSYCEKFAKASKPSTSQSCNTQSCTTSYSCSASVSTTTDSDTGLCKQQTFSPVTGVFPRYGAQIYSGGSPFWRNGSAITGTFHNLTDNGGTCDVVDAGCYVVSGGYKYSANKSKSTQYTIVNQKWHEGDSGSAGCRGTSVIWTCYEMTREAV